MEHSLLAIPGPWQSMWLMAMIGILGAYCTCILDLIKADAEWVEKLFWLMVIFLFPIMGLIAYYVLRHFIEVKTRNGSID